MRDAKTLFSEYLRLGLRSRFARGAAWAIAGAVAARVTSLASTVVIAHLISPRDFGVLSVLLTVFAFASSLGALGLGVAASRHIAESDQLDKGTAGCQIALVSLVPLVLGAVVAAVLALNSKAVAELVLNDPSWSPLVLWSTGVIAAAALLAAQLGVLSGLRSFRALAVALTLRGIAEAVFSIIGAAFYGLSGAVGALSLADLIAAIVIQIVIWRTAERLGISIKLAGWRSAGRPLLRLGLPAFLAALIVHPALLGSQIFLAHQRNGYVENAVFGVSQRWALVVLFLPAAVSPVLLPFLTELRVSKDLHAYRRLLLMNASLMVAITALPSAVLCIFADPVLGIFGSVYRQRGVTVMMILLLATVPTALNSLLSGAALAVDAIAHWVASDLALAFTIGIVAWATIPSMGADGLAWAQAAGYTVTCLVLLRPVLASVGTSPAMSRTQ